MPETKLTSRFCDTVTTAVRTDFQDTMVRGLALRVSPNGTKAWNVRYTRESDGSKQRITLGRYPNLSLEKARTAALKLVMAVAEGDDPATARQAKRDAMTVEDLGSLFITKYAKRNKKTWPEDERLLKREIYPVLGSMKAMAVKRRDLLDIIEAKAEASHIAQSTQILAVVRKMFNWAVDNDYLHVSPAVGIKPRGRAVKRDRVLSNTEIATVWNALSVRGLSAAMQDIVKILFLTGQRSGEVCGITISEIDAHAATWSIPKERTKNGIGHSVPLSQFALEIIAGRLPQEHDPRHALFARIDQPIESNAVSAAVRKHLQFFEDRWTPHDIRRTVATCMAEIGIQPHIIEACLNHISGFRGGVAGVYNRAAYDREKRNAFDRWAEHLNAIIGQKPSVIVPIRGRAQ